MLPLLLSCRSDAADTAYRALCPTACSKGMLVAPLPIPAGLLVRPNRSVPRLSRSARARRLPPPTNRFFFVLLRVFGQAFIGVY